MGKRASLLLGAKNGLGADLMFFEIGDTVTACQRNP
jgi:hypothetical protein